CLFKKGGWDIWLMDKYLDKRHKIPLAPTNWEKARGDTAAPFFRPVTALALDSLTKRKMPSRDSAKGHAAGISDSLSPTEIRPLFDFSKKDSIKTAAADSVKKTGDSTAAALVFDTLKSRPYRLRFAPDFISVGVAVNSFYGSGGSWAASFGDLMGDHQIILQGDLQSDITQYAHLYAAYINLKHRLNWGGGGFYNRAFTNANIFGDSLFYDVDGGAFGLLRFPFSQFSRLEGTLYYQNINRSPYILTDISLSRDAFRGPFNINIIMTTLGYSFDNILWGITGPLAGIRAQANLAVAPPLTFVDHSYISFDGDVRYYWHLFKEFVWANRLAAGASEPLRKGEVSFRRFFLGGEDTWLNYNVNRDQYGKNITSMLYSDFVVPFRGWNYLDLTGTRFAVYNTEFRFPFVREVSLVWPLPIAVRYINGAVFSDIGNAWDPADEYAGIPLPQKIYGGVGYGLRANLGIFVLRYDHAWRTDWRHTPELPIDYYALGAEF
ncbi:MAG: BamA/TamA family outer membrane protein, partial [Chitinivibrionales bacterium]|nr:BamA/TamA family outer membrane protein [Chitinivibrionales bacterium]